MKLQNFFQQPELVSFGATALISIVLGLVVGRYSTDIFSSKKKLTNLLNDMDSKVSPVRGIHKSFQSSAMILRCALNSDYSSKKYEEFFLYLDCALERLVSRSNYRPRIKLVVIEGLSCSGKSAIVDVIVKKLPSKFRRISLPKIVHDIEQHLSDLPREVYYAYQHIKNYLTMDLLYEDLENISNHVIAGDSDEVVYILDSFYHSTCSNTILDQHKEHEKIISLHNYWFQWPFDLLVPNLVLFLCVDSQTRLLRGSKLENSATDAIAQVSIGTYHITNGISD